MKKIISILLLASCSLYCTAQQTEDETAIKKLLEKESATWRSGDAKAHADCWKIQPYSRILVSTGDGIVIDVPPAFIINPSPNAMGNGGTAVNSNYKFSINGNNAWVSHDEASTNKEGIVTYSFEMRMLEKINGEWKLVGQSIHIKAK